MVFVQGACASLACILRGSEFFTALALDSQHPLAVLSVIMGGAALAVGDFAAAAAIEKLGVAVGGPVCFSFMLVCGSLGDFLLEGSANPPLLLAGVVGCMGAVLADSQSHPTPADKVSLASDDSAAKKNTVELPHISPTPSVVGDSQLPVAAAAADKLAGPASAVIEVSLRDDRDVETAKQPHSTASAASTPPSNFRLGMIVAVAGGCIGGMWTVLSTLASHAHPLDPMCLLFFFHVGEVVFIIPVVLVYGHVFGGAKSLPALFCALRGFNRKQTAWTCGAGLCIAVGYLCYFATRDSVPRPAAYGFGCAAGSTGMIWGITYFREYSGASSFKKRLLLLALALYPSSIALIALSMVE